jgi:prevent-host-death family protein
MYTREMAKVYSVVEARKKLPTLLDEVAAGADVQLTRRGRPVAMLVSVDEYERMKAGRTTFSQAYREFRQAHPERVQGPGALYFRRLRARRHGRRSSL